ncbi:MAG: hypothetical protein B6D63_00275 [Candidatus Latescibacteria bacterium 4484_7]|nr:MAG: hypothetical protein B6D63_00275 [Candidatus Latescibacteria bacterium 4484_7]RKZ08827.1 MAG: hypothetical protein DRQ05_00820 [bacterium]
MRHTTAYLPIGDTNDKSPEQTFFFMMNSLLYSRMESGYPSNNEFFDEDVNVYLANLLTSVVYPQYKDKAAKYIMPYDIYLFDNVRLIQNPRTKYEIYKTNADYLLLALGIFDNPKQRRPNSTPYLNLSTRGYIGRTKAYYKFAQSYSYEVFRKNTAIADVLGKLAVGLERYIDVLSTMRIDYLNIVKKISGGELFHLVKTVQDIDIEKTKSSLYDEFLDALSEYKKKGTKKSRKCLEESVAKLKSIDPSFDFKI